MTEETKIIRAVAGLAAAHFQRGIATGDPQEFQQALTYITALKVKAEEMENAS